MTRAWDELMAALFDVVPPGIMLLVLTGGALLIGALWYWYPAWIPRRMPRRRPRQKRVKNDRKTNAKAVPPDEMILTPADQLAAEGRFAEAIRQRLRDTIRDLVAAGVVTPQPGSTAAELAAAAAAQRPRVSPPLDDATALFSEVWYGDRPAGRDHDDHMRALTDEVRDRTVPR